MTTNASRHNDLKAVQYVEPRLRITPLLCMVTIGLTCREQYILCHSPFPQFILFIVGK